MIQLIIGAGLGLGGVAAAVAIKRYNEAEREADANAVLANSLNDQVLQQHYIDALKSIGKDGNLVVVPEGSQPIVGTK